MSNQKAKRSIPPVSYTHLYPNLDFNLSLDSCDKFTFPVKSIFVFAFNSSNAVASIIALLLKFICLLYTSRCV